MSRNRITGTRNRGLGLDRAIDRRDFLNGLALSTMAVWNLGMAPRDVFASRSPGPSRRAWGGNPEAVYEVGHALRDGVFARRLAARNTAEFFDVVVVGGGVSGLVAATALRRAAGPDLKILILENHAVPGGAARMDVLNSAQRPLMAAQGSIVSQVPTPGLAAAEEAIALLRDAAPDIDAYRVPHMDRGFSVLQRSPASGELQLYQSFIDAPIPDEVKAAYVTFLQEAGSFYADENWRVVLESLDNLTFKAYINSRGWPPSVYDWMVPELASFFGIPDQVSAAAVWRQYGGGPPQIHSFPGGNAVFVAGLLRLLWPHAVREKPLVGSPPDSLVNLEMLEGPGSNPTLRLSSTAVHIKHIGEPKKAERVSVTYSRQGSLEQVEARSVLMAGGAFITKYVVRDLPDTKSKALGRFIYAPIVWANVMLDNARALDVANPNFLTMLSGTRASLLLNYDKMNEDGWSSERDSARSAALGLSLPYFYPDEDPQAQASTGRMEMLNTPFATYERWIREDLQGILGPYGFDPLREIAAISVSRWGHGYVFPDPGFLTDGARQTAALPYGRIAYANTDLDGFSHITGAAGQGYRAAQDVLKIL